MQEIASKEEVKKMEETKETKGAKETKNNKNFTNILLIILIVLILLLMMLRCCGQSNTVHEFNPTTTPTCTLTPMPDGPMEGTGYINVGEDYDPEKIKEILNANQNSCSIIASNYLEFTDKESEGELRLKNHNNYHIQVSVLPYDNEVADLTKAYFTSIVIKPGEEMNKIKLTKNLDNLREGTQPCLLYYDCFKEKYEGAYEKEGNEGLTRIGNCGLKISVNMLSTK